MIRLRDLAPRPSSWWLLLPALLLVGACGGRAEQAAHTASGHPQRILALSCSTTETLIALGALDRVVGVEEDCPVRGTEGKTKIRNDDHPGKMFALNVESVLALHPDLVIARPDVRQALEGRGLNILWSPLYTNMHNLPGFVRDVGRAIGDPDKAEAVLEHMRALEKELGARTAGKPRPRVYFETFGLGKTSGAHTIVDDMITLAGGRNIAGDIHKSSVSLTPEAIVKADPEVIILGPFADPMDQIVERPGWQALSAVRNGRVHRIGMLEQEVTLGCPQCVDGCAKLFLPWIHPELAGHDGSR
jgi:iron complex transport system substrate-binding protein